MTPIFPIIELVDRYCIAKLKFEKTSKNQEELIFYQHQLINYDLNLVQEELKMLYQIHDEIWALEKELKSGTEHQLPLEEIGRRAILIRDWNNKRIRLKNTMADKLGQSYLHEIKHDHLSA
jgi:hypothetical protein